MSRRVTPRVALIVAFAAFVGLTAIAGRRLAIQSHSSLSCVVEDSCSGGGAGIRIWLEKLGHTTLPLRRPIWEIAQELPFSGNVLLTAGDGRKDLFGDEAAGDRWHELQNWIGTGNSLIIVTANPESIPSMIQKHLVTDDEVPKPARLAPGSTRSAAKEARYENVVAWWGGSLSVDANGPRLENLAEKMRLAGTQQATVLAAFPVGKGTIFLLLDETAWSNGGFDRADNAATLARLVRQQLDPDGSFVFDEYRHGYGRVESFSSFFVSLPGMSQFTAMLIIWGMMWLWSSTRRFCPPEEFIEVERRTAMEYIESVAQMNQRARAAPLVLNSVLQRTRYLLQKKSLIGEAEQALLDQVARQAALASRPTAPIQEMSLLSKLIQLRKELYGTRPDPRAD